MLLFVILCTFCTVAWSQQSTFAFRNNHKGNETNHKHSSLTSGDIFVPLSVSSTRLSLLESSSSQATRVLTRRDVSTDTQAPIVQHGPGGSFPALRDTRSATAHRSRGQPHYVNLKNNGFKPKPSPAQATFFREQIKHLSPDVRTRLKEIYAQTGFTIGFQNLLKDTLKSSGQYTRVRIPAIRSNDLHSHSDSGSLGSRGNVKAGQSEHSANSPDSQTKVTPMERLSRGDDTKTYRDRSQIAHSEAETSPTLDFTSASSSSGLQYSTSRANEPKYQMSRAGWRQNPGVTKSLASGNMSAIGPYLDQVSSGIPGPLHQSRVTKSRQRHVYATTPELHHRYYPRRPQMRLQLPASRVQYRADVAGDRRARQHWLLRQRELWAQQQHHQPQHPPQHPSQQPLQHPSQQPQQQLLHPSQQPSQQLQHPHQLPQPQYELQQPQQQLQPPQQQLRQPLQQHQQPLQHPQQQLQQPMQLLQQSQQQRLQLQQPRQQLQQLQQQLQLQQSQLQLQQQLQQPQQQTQLHRPQKQLQHPQQQLQPQQLQHAHQQAQPQQPLQQQQLQRQLQLQQQQQLPQPPLQHFQQTEPNRLFPAQPTFIQQQRQRQQQQHQLQQQQRQLLQQQHKLQQQRQRQQQLPYSGDHRTNSHSITPTMENVQARHQTPDKTTQEAATLRQPNLKIPSPDNKSTRPLQQSIVSSDVSPLEHQAQAVAKFRLNTDFYAYRAEESGHAPQISDVANTALAKSIQSSPNHYQSKDITVIPGWQKATQTRLPTLPSRKLIIETSTLAQPTTTRTTTTTTATTTMVILQPLIPSHPLQTPSTVAPPINTTVVLSEHANNTVALNVTHMEVIQKPRVTTEATKSTQSLIQVHQKLPSNELHPSINHNSTSSFPTTTFSITSTDRSPSLGTTSPEATVFLSTTPVTRTTTKKVVPLYKPDVLLTPALFLTWSLPSSQITRLMGSELQTVLSSINASRSQPGLTYNSKVEQFRTFLIQTLLEDPRSYTVTSEDIHGKKFHERTDEGPSIVVKVLLPGFLNDTRIQINTRQKRSCRVAILNINGGKHHVVALTSAVTDNSKGEMELGNSPKLSLVPPMHNISRIRYSSTLSDLHDMNRRAKTGASIKATPRVNIEHKRRRKKRKASFRNDPLVPVLRFIWLLPEGSFPPTPGETVDFIMNRFKRKPQPASSEYSTGNSTTYSNNSINIGNSTIYSNNSINIGNSTIYSNNSINIGNSTTYSNNSVNIGNSTIYSNNSINIGNSTTYSENSNRSHHSTVSLTSVASTIPTNVSSHTGTQTNAGYKDTATPNADVLVAMLQSLTQFNRIHGEKANGIKAIDQGSQNWTAPNINPLETLLRPQRLEKGFNTHSNIRIADGEVSKANNSDNTRQLLPTDAMLAALQSLARNHSYARTMPAADWLVSNMFEYFNQSDSSQPSRGFNTQPTGSGDANQVTPGAMFKWIYDNIIKTRAAMTSGNASAIIRMNTNESPVHNTNGVAASASAPNISPAVLHSRNLSSLTLRNTSLPSLPPLNTTHQSFPSPNTSHPSLPSLNTSRPSLPPPNTSRPSLPSSNTSHLSLPSSNTSRPSLPPPNTSHPSLPPPNTSHPFSPHFISPSPALPPPNTLHPSLPPPNTPTPTLPVSNTRPPSLTPLHTSPPSLPPLHTSPPSLPPLNTSPSTTPLSTPSPSSLADSLTRKQNPEIPQSSPPPTMTPYYDDKHILHPDTKVGESQGQLVNPSPTFLPHVSLLSHGLSSTPLFITPSVAAFLSSKNTTMTSVLLLNQEESWKTHITTPAIQETSFARPHNRTWNHNKQRNTFDNLADVTSTSIMPVSSNTNSSENYVRNAASVDPSNELVLNFQPRSTHLLEVANLTPLAGTTSVEGLHSAIINEVTSVPYKPTHELTPRNTTTHASPNISHVQLTTPASANHLSTSSFLYFDTNNSSNRNPSIEQLYNVASVADRHLAPDSILSAGNNILASNSDPSEFNSQFSSPGRFRDVTDKINLESAQHVHSKQAVAGSNTSPATNVGGLNNISLTEGGVLNNLTSTHQDAGKSGPDRSYFNGFMELLWNVIQMMADRKSAQNPAITTTTMKPQTTTPGLCPAGLAMTCAPAKASARLMTFCQQRCDLSTGFCSTALCMCVCGDENVADHQAPQPGGMMGWGSLPAARNDLNLIESGNVFISGFDPELAPASSPRPVTTTKVTLPGIPTVSDEHINTFLEYLAMRNEGRHQGHKNSNKESEVEW